MRMNELLAEPGIPLSGNPAAQEGECREANPLRFARISLGEYIEQGGYAVAHHEESADHDQQERRYGHKVGQYGVIHDGLPMFAHRTTVGDLS